MKKPISVVGSGYVGLVTGIAFADLGHKVIFIDVVEDKISSINNGKPPIYEKGLAELMEKNRDRYYATGDYGEGIGNSQITIIAVGTPSREDGSIDLKYVREAARSIGKELRKKEDWHTVIVKSTVLPGTTEEVVKTVLEEESGKTAYRDFGLGMNPEFLREGRALEDFFNPDRIVLGANDERTMRDMEELYSSFRAPLVKTDIKTAEAIKYVSNAFLALKISFANEIGNYCKKKGIDTWKVFEAVGMDKRINPSFFRSGIGFGGSCFPKDVRALVNDFGKVGISARITRGILEVNDEQPLKAVELLQKHLQVLEGRTIGILGLAFKPDTDDIRESRAIPIISELIKRGAKVKAYDPMATMNFRKIFPDITYTERPEDVLDSDAVVIVTEWEEFEKIDYSGKIVVDGRRVEKAMKTARIYEGVCW